MIAGKGGGRPGQRTAQTLKPSARSCSRPSSVILSGPHGGIQTQLIRKSSTTSVSADLSPNDTVRKERARDCFFLTRSFGKARKLPPKATISAPGVPLSILGGVTWGRAIYPWRRDPGSRYLSLAA